jgi:hypothetical protein
MKDFTKVEAGGAESGTFLIKRKSSIFSDLFSGKGKGALTLFGASFWTFSRSHLPKQFSTAPDRSCLNAISHLT